MSSEELLDHPFISERLFFPHPDPVQEPWVVHGGAGPLHGVRKAPHGGPSLLLCPGNGEYVAAWGGRFADRLVAQGIDVFVGAYRGYGSSAGRPALAAMLDDALITADATGVPPERLVLYGRSIGSLYALHVAAHRPVAGLVLESGVGDVLEVFRRRVQPADLDVEAEQLEQALARRFDRRAKVEACRCPMLVMHALRDRALEPEHARLLAGWAGDRAELVLFEEGNHNTIHFRHYGEILRRVIEFTQAAVAAR